MAETAVKLAEMYNLCNEKAYTAGLLHDCAKCFTKEKLTAIINEHLELDKDELINPKTYHAPVGAYFAKTFFNIDDEEILSAIRWHTLGKPDMSDFEKIIFIADKIEPYTRQVEYINTISSKLNEDNGLDKAMLECFKETIKSLAQRELKICKSTIDIYNGLLSKYEKN